MLSPEFEQFQHHFGEDVCFVPVTPVAGIRRVITCAVKLLRLEPITYTYYSISIGKRNFDAIKNGGFDTIFVIRLSLSSLTKFRNLSNVIFYDAVDCFSQQTRLFRRHARGIKKLVYTVDSFLLPRYERLIGEVAAACFITTSQEATKMATIARSQAKYIPVLHFDLPVIKNRAVVPKERRVVSLGFHGKLSYFQNELAVRELSNIERECDFTEIRVFGRASDQMINRYPNIRFEGFVSSLSEAYCGVDLAVFPIDKCVGIQNKVVEALCIGVPVLITPEIFAALPNKKIDLLLERFIYVREKFEMAEFLNLTTSYRSVSLDAEDHRVGYCTTHFSGAAGMQTLYEEILGGSETGKVR